MKPRAEPRPGASLHRAWLPWFVYVGVTVVAPAMHGAWRERSFIEHVSWTLVVSGALLGAWLLLARVARRA